MTLIREYVYLCVADFVNVAFEPSWFLLTDKLTLHPSIHKRQMLALRKNKTKQKTQHGGEQNANAEAAKCVMSWWMRPPFIVKTDTGSTANM